MLLLKDLIADLFSNALTEIAGEPLQARIEYAREEKFGDYACTSALDQRIRDACKIKNPRQLAEAIVEKIASCTIDVDLPGENQNRTVKLSGSDCFEKTEIAGPGFVNVTLSSSLLMLLLMQILNTGESYGSSRADSPRKILFEFVSANPTGPLNVVSARAAALGDSCCNLLQAAGHEVFREYYVNDYGNQVFLLGISCLLRLAELDGAKLLFAEKSPQGPHYEDAPGLRFPDQGYHGQYLIDAIKAVTSDRSELLPSAELRKKLVELSDQKQDPTDTISLLENLHALEVADALGNAVVEYLRSSHERDLESFRVQFDRFFSERSLHEEGRVLEVLQPLSNYIFEEDGKKLFRSTDFGDDKDRVVVRDDGRPTYLLADIAYHRTKIERGFKEIIDIWGPDHHGYIARLKGAMKALGVDDNHFNVLIAQQVNLLSNGEPVVMSKRTGQFVTLKELIEEIPLDVVRYFFVMRSFEAHLDFDLEEAKDTSDKNPYYYVGYAHARVRSIFRRAAEERILSENENLTKSLKSPANAQNLQSSLPDWLANQLGAIQPMERRRLIWLAARFPEEVRDAADSYEPHRLINTLYQLAQALSRFYGVPENKVLTRKPEEARLLLCILEAIALCIRNGLKLLGMEAPEKMSREPETQAAE